MRIIVIHRKTKLFCKGCTEKYSSIFILGDNNCSRRYNIYEKYSSTSDVQMSANPTNAPLNLWNIKKKTLHIVVLRASAPQQVERWLEEVWIGK